MCSEFLASFSDLLLFLFLLDNLTAFPDVGGFSSTSNKKKKMKIHITKVLTSNHLLALVNICNLLCMYANVKNTMAG